MRVEALQRIKGRESFFQLIVVQECFLQKERLPIRVSIAHQPWFTASLGRDGGDSLSEVLECVGLDYLDLVPLELSDAPFVLSPWCHKVRVAHFRLLPKVIVDRVVFELRAVTALLCKGDGASSSGAL